MMNVNIVGTILFLLRNAGSLLLHLPHWCYIQIYTHWFWARRVLGYSEWSENFHNKHCCAQ